MKKTFLVAAVGAAALAGTSTASAASLLGDTIHGYYEYPTQSTVYQDLGTFSAPGGGPLFGDLSYEVSGNQVSITLANNDTFWTPATFNGFTFVDISSDPDITGITLDPSTTANGASASDASFTFNSMSFNFQGQRWSIGQSAVFDLTFGGVPEPSTWAIMLFGFFGLGAILRSARRKSVKVKI
jgi:hypothetical protein